jgi:DNA polymerase-1
MTKRILLVDADIFAFACASAGQKKWDFGDGEVSIVVEDISKVTPGVDNKIAELKAQLEADEVILCLSCATADGWRIKILPTYKANRGEKPVLLAAVKQYMREHYHTFERPTLEADDVMGILSTSTKLYPGTQKIIVSIDKDMKTIPGWLFNPDKDPKPWKVSEEEADYWHMYQTLVGDTTDNYKGLPGCGPKGADKLLLTFPDIPAWTKVAAAFKAKGLTEDDAILQARVARICRSTDYDYSKKEVKLWNPLSRCGPQGSASTSSASSPTKSTSKT